MTDDLTAIVRELQTAQRILANPDRHTTAELEYAEQRVRTLTPLHAEALMHQYADVWQSVQAWACDLLRHLNEQVGPMLRAVYADLERAGWIAAPSPTRPPRRRAELRAAKCRAMLSTLRGQGTIMRASVS